MSKKILIINNGLAGGGIERASSSLANHFANLGHEVQVLALYQDEIVFKLNEQIKFVEPSFNRNTLGKAKYLIKLAGFIRNETQKFDPHTILAFSEWTNPYVVIALLGLKYPIYLSDRMNPLAKLPLASEILKRITYRKASGIIAQTNFAKRILYNKTRSKRIYVIYNPVNIIKPTDDQELDLIISVGRLSPEKGHQYLIKAFSKVKNKDWKLGLVGDGSERKILEKIVLDLDLNGRVFFYGHLSDFSMQLTQAKIFVLPSLKEGFPNALIEAMAMGKASICSDFFDGENEIIEDTVNGIIVSPGNIEELHFAIEKLIENDTDRLRMGMEAKKIGKKLEFSRIASQYLNVILNDENTKTSK